MMWSEEEYSKINKLILDSKSSETRVAAINTKRIMKLEDKMENLTLDR